LVVGVSGNVTAPITFGAYGIGNKPVISGFNTLSSWSSVGGGVYRSYCASCNSSLNMVTVNGVQKGIGRYPNSGYLTFESHYAKSSITDNELPSNPVWTGAEVVIRTSHWTLDRDIITSHIGNTITYTAPLDHDYIYEPDDGFGYFIQNDPKTLDQFGEWYFNPSTKYLQMYFGSNNPSNYLVKASTLDILLPINGRSYITFDNIRFEGSNVATINMGLSTPKNIHIQNCEIDFSGTNGIRLYTYENPSYIFIENNLINNTNNNGIHIGESWRPAQYVTLRNNIIENTAIIPGMGKSGTGAYAGIILNGDYGMIELNKIINTGYMPIEMYGNYNIAQKNFIDRLCLSTDDCGGIYTYRGDPYTVPATRAGNKILNNIILNCIGATDGTTEKDFGAASGIYLDGYSNGIEVRGNTVANCDYAGIFMNSNPDGLIQDNVLFDNRRQISLQATWNTVRNHRNLTIKNNTMFSKNVSRYGFEFADSNGDIDPTLIMNNNYYVRPMDDMYTIHAITNKSAVLWIGEWYTLEDWQVKQGLDINSKKSPKRIPQYSINSLIGSNKFSNGNFDSTLSGVGYWNNVTSYVLSWDNTKLDGGALKVSYNSEASTTTLISFSVGTISSSKTYILNYTFFGSTKNKNYHVYLRKTGSPYNLLEPKRLAPVNTSRIENEFFILHPQDETVAASIVFEMDRSVGTFWLDNVRLYEADLTLNNPDQYMRLEYNTENTDKVVPLSGNYVGVDGKSYSGSVILKPFTSIVLIKN